jgi:outer membrane immunogenic protein
MKKILASMAITAALGSTAFAADLPVKAAPMMSAPVAYSWTGCYLGAGGGYGMADLRHTGVLGATVTAESDTAGKGWFGTVQAGCDYQFSDRWVVGAFGDYDFGRIKGNYLSGAPGGGFGAFGEEKQKDSWAVGGRVGYLVLPKLLAYAAAGYTQARFDSFQFFDNVTRVATPSVMPSQTYRGWFLATGYEYGLDMLPGLFWKTEYRYSNFREETFAAIGGGVTERIKPEIQTVRSELVYRFNWGGPVVARY